MVYFPFSPSCFLMPSTVPVFSSTLCMGITDWKPFKCSLMCEPLAGLNFTPCLANQRLNSCEFICQIVNIFVSFLLCADQLGKASRAFTRRTLGHEGHTAHADALDSSLAEALITLSLAAKSRSVWTPAFAGVTSGLV